MNIEVEEFYRLEIEGEEFLDNDMYTSVLNAFKDIPDRMEELAINDYKFKKSRPFKITYIVQKIDSIDYLTQKTILKIDPTKLLLKL